MLELVEGPTLAEHLANGPMPVGGALDMAGQIGEALEAAHASGIICRDLKPSTIKVRANGTVKVLDFGLAEAVAGKLPNPALTDSPTLSIAGTRAGVLLGTAEYMSPEQASGQALDSRTDIWSFGASSTSC